MIAAFNEDIKNNGTNNYISQLIIISIKSLLPSEDLEKVPIDYKRYNEEIKLWKNYKNGDNPSLLNLFNMDSNIYWEEKDSSLYMRILPIIMVNKDFSNIKDEIIKNTLFTTGDIESLIETILIGKLIFLLMEKEEKIVEKLKEEIINLSQIEYIEEYEKYYRFPINEYKGNFKISFEQKKISALNILNASYSKDFQVLEDCLIALNSQGNEKTPMGRIVRKILNGELEENTVPDYYKELIEYLYRLRKGRISPDILRIENYHLPDVFEFKEGDEFYHSLLNRCRVLKKEKRNNEIIIYLNTKSGIYEFRK